MTSVRPIDDLGPKRMGANSYLLLAEDMPLDWSALAPGPMGTAMLGESGIEGAARRGRERIQREQEGKALGDNTIDKHEESQPEAAKCNITASDGTTDREGKRARLKKKTLSWFKKR
ncbi:unnamed protein product [Penicillium bialowiezense]